MSIDKWDIKACHDLWCSVVRKAVDDLDHIRPDYRLHRDYNYRWKYLDGLDAYDFLFRGRRLEPFATLIGMKPEAIRETVWKRVTPAQHAMANHDSTVDNQVPPVQQEGACGVEGPPLAR